MVVVDGSGSDNKFPTVAEGSLRQTAVVAAVDGRMLTTRMAWLVVDT